MVSNEAWWVVNNIEDFDSPALIIYLDRVKENIRLAKSMVDDIRRLRPHVKTHKTIEATRLMMEAGIQKFKCATIAEGEMLGISGAADVLLAYQPVGPKLERFVSLIKKYPATHYSCLTDNGDAARHMAAVFAGNKLEIPVYIDLNVGQNRTGIPPGAAAIQLYIDCSRIQGIEPVGLHAYDGHIRDVEFELRQKHCDEAFAGVEKMRATLVEKGLQEPLIIAGGSPTFFIHAKRKRIECSPGTFIFWDKGYLDLCPEQPFQTAALVVTRVVSLPADSKLCLDLGHKSIAAENELKKRVYFLNAPELIPLSHSEEHLVEEYSSTHAFKTGDILYGLPFHICPTISLYERGFTVEDRRINGEWRIVARDRTIGV